MGRSIFKGIVVIFGALVLTSFTIDATDSFQTSQTALSLLTSNVVESACPEGTTLVALSDGDICIDTYENSASDSCPVTRITSFVDTEENISASACQAVSVSDVTPWTFVSYHQAKTLCAQRGMRLPTHREWYEASLGTKESECNINGRVQATGAISCLSSFGLHDAIGNVWEWIDGEVSDGMFNGRPYPAEGYVTAADANGVPLETANIPSILYGDDYTWATASGTYAMMRGGYFGSREDAGLFSVHANIESSFASAAIGFRCVKRR